MTWALELLDFAAADGSYPGASRGVVVPATMKLTRRLSSWSSVEFTVTQDSIGAGAVSIGAVVRLWQLPGPDAALDTEGTCRFQGTIGEPLTVTADDSGMTTVTAVAHDAFERYRGLFFYELTALSSGIPRTAIESIISTYGGTIIDTDPSDIVYSTLDISSVFEFTAGTSLHDAIMEIAATDACPYFVIEPVTGTANTLVYIRFLGIRQNSGSDLTGVRFEFGEGTKQNLTRYQVEVSNPINNATVAGSDSGQYAIATDGDSFTAYGERGVYTSKPGTFLDLDVHADGLLKPTPPRVYSVEVAPYGEQLDIPYPFEDFDVADRVRVTARTGIPEFDAEDVEVRVNEFALSVDENGAERLTSITVEEV